MSQTCRPAKCIEAIRIALLDQCTLLPLCGPNNGYAMGCIIDPDWTPEIEEGDESIVKDNCGEICLQDLGCDQLKRHSLEFKIARPDHEFIAMIGGDNLIVNGGESVGVQSKPHHCSPWLFVELFEKTEACDAEGQPVYFRHVFPRTRLVWTGNEREGIFRLLQIEGKTQSVPISLIGTGPYDDIPAYAIASSPGEQSDYIEFEDTTLPVVQCGAIEVPCPIVELPTLAFGFSSNCQTIELSGSNFDLVDHVQFPEIPADYYDPAGPNSGLNPGTATILQWTSTIIEILDTALNDPTITTVNMLGVGDVPDYGAFSVGDPFDVPNCPPTVNQIASSPACDTFQITGTDFDLVNRLVAIGGSGWPQDYYDPAGPDAGLNPGSVTINSWTPTLIDITDTGIIGTPILASVHLYGVANTPDWGFFNINPDVSVTPCDGPTLTNATETDCETIQLTGTGFDTVNHIFLDGIGIDYYDPAGPDAGLNPGTATIISWTSTTIEIFDGQFDNGGTYGVHMWGVADSPDFGDFYFEPAFPNIQFTPCPVLIDTAFSPECFVFEINGNGFNNVNQIVEEIQGLNYFDPLGPDAGSNPVTATILSWTPTLIRVYDSQLTGIQFEAFHMYGTGGSPDYGNIDVPDFTVDECPTPSAVTANSPACETIEINGIDFDNVGHILVGPGIGTSFYDPTGPNAGLNPGTATINVWSDTQISITDPVNLVGNSFQVHMWGTGDTPDYGLYPYTNFVIAAC